MADLKNEKPLRLNVGCGNRKKEGFINIDRHDKLGADKIHLLPAPLPYDDNSVDEVYSSHVLEDLISEDVYNVVNDFVRVLKKGGILRLKMPHLSHPCFHNSIFHQSPFGINTFYYLIHEKEHYHELQMCSKILKKHIRFFHKEKALWYSYGWWNEPIVNCCDFMQKIYEFTIWSKIFPAFDCEWIIQK